MPRHCPSVNKSLQAHMWQSALGKMGMNKGGAGGKEEEAEKDGTCLPSIPVCSVLQKPITSQVGSTALSRDAQVLLSLVEAGLFPSVTEWRRSTNC